MHGSNLLLNHNLTLPRDFVNFDLLTRHVSEARTDIPVMHCDTTATRPTAVIDCVENHTILHCFTACFVITSSRPSASSLQLWRHASDVTNAKYWCFPITHSALRNLRNKYYQNVFIYKFYVWSPFKNLSLDHFLLLLTVILLCAKCLTTFTVYLFTYIVTIQYHYNRHSYCPFQFQLSN